MYRARDAAAYIGRDHKTLADWLARYHQDTGMDLAPASSPTDRRLRLYSQAQLDTLIAWHEEYVQRGVSPHPPPTLPPAPDQSPATTTFTVQQLQQQMEQLARQLSALIAPAVATVQALALAMPTTLPPASETVPTIPAAPRPSGPSGPSGPQRAPAPSAPRGEPLPAGYMALSSWCALHRVDSRSVERAIDAGAMPAPVHCPDGRPWQSGTNRIRRAYAPEQHMEACRRAQERWPASFVESCGSACPYARALALADADGDNTVLSHW